MIPKIDPRVRYVGTSYLRKLNAETLRELDGAIVVRDNDEPLAVIVSYQTYLAMQKEMAFSVVRGPVISYDDQVSVQTQHLDAVGPALADGRGKATTETTRSTRGKGERLK
jgi:hypothetical protein